MREAIGILAVLVFALVAWWRIRAGDPYRYERRRARRDGAYT